MSDLFSLAGKTALVTGSSRGLGFAMAAALAQHGATVALNSRSAEGVGEAVGKLKADGLDVIALPFDVSDAQATTAALADLVGARGGLDILINNAGVQHRAPVTECGANILWHQVSPDHYATDAGHVCVQVAAGPDYF